MAIPQGVWGIDVGQCALKALRLEMIEGTVTATAFDYVEHPKILSQPDADPDQLTREALETFLSRNSIKGDMVAMSIAGQSGLARFVKLPPVEEKKIADIVRFEAKQQIPFPLDEVVWDFQKIGAGVVTDGFAMDTEVGLFAMKRDMINRFLHHFQAVNVEIHIVQMAPLALCNYVAYDLLKCNADGSIPEGTEIPDDTPSGKKRCAVALDIGTDGSSLIITDGNRIIWQRPIPIGGNHFTRALTKELKLTFAKAEHLKRNAAKSPDLAKILKALKPVLTDFVNEVQRSLGYFTNTHRDAHIAFMVGLGSAFRLPGLQKFLSEKLTLDVRKPAAMERLSGDSVVSAPAFVEHLLTFPVAYGLCLQGLKLSRLTTNLLPQEIQFDRMIRAKKPWSVAAAAAILLGVGVASFGFGMKTQSLGQPKDYEKHKGDKIADAVGEARGAAGDAKKIKDKETSGRTKVAETAKEVKTIINGKDERSNWIRINEFVSRCLPRPDGTNLLNFQQFKIDQRKYRTQAAMDAWTQYRQRLLGEGNVSDLPLDDSALQNLIDIDIESLNSQYVPDGRAFYEKAKAEIKSKFSETMVGLDSFTPPDGPGAGKSYSDNLPAGEGWIIELRGHTYNRNARDFLRDTLVFNINYKGHFGDLPVDPNEKFPDAIKGRVSHAFIYNYWPVDNPQPDAFTHINDTILPSLTGGGAGGGGGAGAGGGAPAGPPVSGPNNPGMAGGGGGGTGAGGGGGDSERANWKPLGSLTLGGSGGGNANGNQGMSGPGTTGVPGAGGGTGAGGAAQANRAGVRRRRFEFVLMFYWREPLGVDSKETPATAPK
jgi:type IV pilus assembly protein PilM